ncbi:MAG: transporter [Clostridia bacterium]|jgi:tungstate transport system ATP-binding protein|nr:transporter [Clostridia bacterium]
MKITVNNLRKTYDGKQVLSVDSLEVKKGCITGIIGPNGSGKSTLMRLISGIEKADSGTVAFEDKKASEETWKGITLVFQKPYLINTTVYENIAYPLKLRGAGKDEISRRVETMLELLELGSIRHRNARTLSGGEGQKAALARAMVFEPQLLLLDEPTANIDPKSIYIMEKAIRHINEKVGATVLLVTHNVRQLKRLCSYGIFMNNGSVEIQGAVGSLFEDLDNTPMGSFISEEFII